MIGFATKKNTPNQPKKFFADKKNLTCSQETFFNQSELNKAVVYHSKK